MTRTRKRFFQVAFLAGMAAAAWGQSTRPAAEGEELPVARIPHPGQAAEAYFSPSGERLICNSWQEDDDGFQVYTMRLDGTDLVRVNSDGADACAFYFPDGQHVIWTSTRDHLDLPAGDFSDEQNYPQGAELYVSAPDGSRAKQVTDNTCYDAEVSVSPDGKWVLFTRQIDGLLDLWRMRPDGSGAQQITHTPEWQEGGAFYLPDSETILYRAWKVEVQGQRGMPMTIFTIRHDGTETRRITTDDGTNWAPYPAPDGVHFAYVRKLPPHNFELYLGSLESDEILRLTFHPAFDGFPAISPDGRTVLFSSGRDAAPGERALHLFTLDVSSLGLGKPAGE